MKKKTVNKKNGKRIFSPKEKGSIQDLYDKGLIFDRDKKSKSKPNKKVPTPISKKEAFAKHKKRTGSYHMADPLHPKNREGMGVGRKYGGTVKKKSGGSVGHCNRLY